MSKAFSEIRIFSSDYVAVAADGTMIQPGFIKGNKPLTQDLTRIDLEELENPKELSKRIQHDLDLFPQKISDFLYHMEKYRAATNASFTLAHAGGFALGLGRQAIERIQSQLAEAGADTEKTIMFFSQLARSLAQGHTPHKIISNARAFLKSATATETARREKVRARNVIIACPHQLAAAMNKIGADILLKKGDDSNNSSQYEIRTASFRLDSPHCSEALFPYTAEEELVHYLDSYLGFSERPEWQNAVRNDLVSASTQEMRDSMNALIGKNPLSVYKERYPTQFNSELLADVIRSMDSLKRMLPEDIREDCTKFFYSNLSPLAEKFLEEVALVAKGIHPKQMQNRGTLAKMWKRFF